MMKRALMRVSQGLAMPSVGVLVGRGLANQAWAAPLEAAATGHGGQAAAASAPGTDLRARTARGRRPGAGRLRIPRPLDRSRIPPPDDQHWHAAAAARLLAAGGAA